MVAIRARVRYTRPSFLEVVYGLPLGLPASPRQLHCGIVAG
jgi:hypothetical protein